MARLTLPSPRAARRAASAASCAMPFFDQQVGDLRLGERVEPHHLAARNDRFELELGRGADQDQQGPRRRLFQRLQERVGRFLVQVVGIVKDRYLASPARWLQAELVAQVADHTDRQLVLVFRLGGLDEVGVGGTFDLHAAGADPAGVELGVRAGFAQRGLASACGRRSACRSPRAPRIRGHAGTALDASCSSRIRRPDHGRGRSARTRSTSYFTCSNTVSGSLDESIKTMGAG